MKSHQLYNRYKELDKDLTQAFKELTEGKEIVFAELNTDDYWDLWEDLPEADYINKHGEHEDLKIAQIKDSKLITLDKEQEETVINFQDINDIYYKLKLIEAVELTLKK